MGINWWDHMLPMTHIRRQLTCTHRTNEQVVFYQQTRSCHNNQRMENKLTRPEKWRRKHERQFLILIGNLWYYVGLQLENNLPASIFEIYIIYVYIEDFITANYSNGILEPVGWIRLHPITQFHLSYLS